MAGKRMGRPPRSDRPETMGVRLPRALRGWLRGQAQREGRTMSDVVTRALEAYQRKVARRGGKP